MTTEDTIQYLQLDMDLSTFDAMTGEEKYPDDEAIYLAEKSTISILQEMCSEKGYCPDYDRLDLASQKNIKENIQNNIYQLGRLADHAGKYLTNQLNQDSYDAFNAAIEKLKGLDFMNDEKEMTIRNSFMNTVYDILAEDPTNDRANLIIDAFDKCSEQLKEFWKADVQKPSMSVEYAEDLLAGKIKDLCENHFDYHSYEVVYDYDEKISEGNIMQSYNEYCENNDGYLSFQEYLYDKYYDEICYFSGIGQIEDIIKERNDMVELAEIEKALQPKYENLNDAISEICESYNIEITYDVSKLIPECHLNIMLATENERNFDMGAITDFFQTDLSSANGKELMDCYDNALTYLIHQQGYEVSQLLDIHYGDKEPVSTFLKSVSNEINNNYYSGMSELAILASAKGNELLKTLDNISKGTGCLEVSKDAVLGLYNEWSGTGSDLDIELEKSLIFPTNMIRNLQIESKSQKLNDGYTINAVYGFGGDAWKAEVKRTKDSPTLLKEDSTKVLDKLEHFTKETKEKSDIER